jgi:hypothetical protein
MTLPRILLVLSGLVCCSSFVSATNISLSNTGGTFSTVAWPVHANSVDEFRSYRNAGFPFATGVSLDSQTRTTLSEARETFLTGAGNTYDHPLARIGFQREFLHGKHISCLRDGGKSDPAPPVVPESSTMGLLVVGMVGLLGTGYLRRPFGNRA